ncbi:hypothetical protein B7486_25920 [cyanobacterium TDX16]|nr:hypothetical protein B7486_25920 [cyanobacterium TDX16]
MTTHNAFPFDLAASMEFRRAQAPARVAEPRSRPSRRALLGGCLLSLPRIVWMLLDMALVCGGMILGDSLFVWWGEPSNLLAQYQLWVSNAVLAISVILAGSMVGLYEPSTLWVRSRIVVRCLITVTFAMLGTWLVLHLFMYSNLSRRAAACGTFVFLLTGSGVRLLCHAAVLDVRRGLLVIGQGPLTGSIIRSVRRGSVPGYRLVGVVNTDRSGASPSGVCDIPVVGQVDDIDRICREHDVAEIVVAETVMRNPKFQRTALAGLHLGCRVTDESTFYESTYGEVPVSHITPQWFLAADLKGHRQEHSIVKRLLDFIIAAAALIVALPLMLLIALTTRLTSRGPVFYTQTRVGQGGQTFTLFKFRTMIPDAEAGGSTWATENDPRVTRLGRVLRCMRLDELPQLWNIIKGDMSLVGPRPERPEFVVPLSTIIPYYEERHLIKPGLTGWAQINYPYGSTIADARRKLQLDLYYMKHTSLELDLIVMLRTFGTFFLGSR